MIKLKDSRGKESHTLGFVYIAFTVGTIAFLYATYKSGIADLVGYGGFVFGSMMPYVIREWKEKDAKLD